MKLIGKFHKNIFTTISQAHIGKLLSLNAEFHFTPLKYTRRTTACDCIRPQKNVVHIRAHILPG